MVRGERPDIAHLVGWEHRGTNLPATSALLGLRRFIKGFTTDEHGATVGYNKSVPGSDLTTPWTPRPQRDGRVVWAPFTVAPVDPEAVDNRHLAALLLDYGAVPCRSAASPAGSGTTWCGSSRAPTTSSSARPTSPWAPAASPSAGSRSSGSDRCRSRLPPKSTGPHCRLHPRAAVHRYLSERAMHRNFFTGRLGTRRPGLRHSAAIGVNRKLKAR